MARAQGSTANDIESKMMEYLGEAVVDRSPFSIQNDGPWTFSLGFTIGESLPVDFEFTGTGSLIDGVEVSSDVSLLPTGLRNELRQLGVTNLDLQVGWYLYISGDFLKGWASNAFGLLSQIWAAVTNIVDNSTKAIGSIVP